MATRRTKPGGSRRPEELFLSHASSDHRFTQRLADVLSDHGLKPWFSAKNIGNATQWHNEIGKALERCDWFIVVLTPNSVKSKWVQHELLYALNHDRYADRVIPLLKKRCDFEKLSWTLDQLQRVDFTGKFEDGCRSLLKTWQIDY